ncbi:MAG: ACT domain-containing protein [Candidatus Heimdallarchaeota archaeon]|nr:ACT domain-containing protein [Candidatus Heimdallarchaeota archaeon]
MKEDVEIVRLKKEGQINLPERFLKNLELKEEMFVMLRADFTQREIQIIPFFTADAKLVEFQITLADKPGSLAKTATFLGEHNINLIASEARVIRQGEIAEWKVIADISDCKEDTKKLCQQIVEKGVAKKAVCQEFH